MLSGTGLPTLVDTRLLTQANLGGGKSWLLRLIVERAEIQTIVMDSEGEAESTETVISLMSQSLKRGYAGVIATQQRLSKLHKDAAAGANNVVIGRA
jgi:DNA helicase HerA-like ATPase